MSAFFFNDTATTEIYTLSLHDALPISRARGAAALALHARHRGVPLWQRGRRRGRRGHDPVGLLEDGARSEEHTSELQSQSNLVCRLLLEKKKKNHLQTHPACS